MSFVDERCKLDPTATISKDALYTAYTEWVRVNGHKESVGKVIFGKQLKARYTGMVIDKNTAGSRNWAGITLLLKS